MTRADVRSAPPRWRGFLPAWLRGLIWVEQATSFDGFLSYSWKGESSIAPVIQSVLQTFLRPWYKPRALNIFRDLASLAASSSLQSSLEEKIDQSKHLIVLASSTAAASEGMEFEAKYWFSKDREGTVLIVVTEPIGSGWDHVHDRLVPPSLQKNLESAPLWIDLSAHCQKIRGNPSHYVKGEITEALSQLILAFYPGKSWPELRGEERRLRRRTMALVWSAVAALALTSAVAVWKAIEATTQTAIANARLATSHLLSSRTSADNGDAAESLLGIAAAERLHQGDPEADRIDRIRFATTLHASPRLLRVQPGGVNSVTFDADGRRWIAYSDSAVDVVETSTGRRLFHLQTNPDTYVDFDDAGLKVATAVGPVVRVWDVATGRALTELRHASDVKGVRFRPGSGDELAVMTDKEGVQVWRLSAPDSGGAQRRFRIAGATRIRYSGDGARLLTYSDEPAVDIWDASTGKKSLRIENAGNIYSVAFSRDGSKIAIATVEGIATIRDARTGDAIGKPAEPVERWPQVWFSRDGTKLAISGGDKTRIVDASTGASLTSNLPNLHSVTQVLFTDDSRFAVTLGDGMIRAWDATTGRHVAWIARRNAHDFDLRGNSLIVADEHDSRLWAFDFAGGVLLPAQRPDDEIMLARFSDSALRFVTASFGGPVRVWEIANGAPRVIWSVPEGGRVDALAITRDGEHILTTDREEKNNDWRGFARLWSVSRTTPNFSVVHEGIISDVAFSPDGTRFATASWDGTARVWSAADGHPITPLLPHDKRVFSVRFSADGRSIVTASEDGFVRIWDSMSGSRRATLPHPPQPAYAEFSSDGKYVVTATITPRTNGPTAGSAVIWTVNGRRLRELRHADNVLHAAFTLDGKRVATASLDRTARIWDAKTGQPQTPPLQHADRLWFVRFSPDGRLVVTTCYDGTARVWDVRTGLPVTPMLWHRGGVQSADFSADSRWLVTTSRRGDISLFDLAPDARPVDVLDADARISSQEQIISEGGIFPLDQAQFARDSELLAGAHAAH